MAKNKTSETEIDVTDFINSFVENDQKKLVNISTFNYWFLL